MQFDLDTVDDQGMTPLMRAAQRGNFKVVQMFIKCGASPLLSGPSGRASDVALQNNFPAVSEFLKKVEEVQQTEASRRVAAESESGSAVVA
jgi:ankyrin repeat protein